MDKQVFKIMTNIDIAFLIDKLYRAALQERPFRVIIEPLPVAPEPTVPICPKCGKECQCFWCQASVDDADKYYMEQPAAPKDGDQNPHNEGCDVCSQIFVWSKVLGKYVCPEMKQSEETRVKKLAAPPRGGLIWESLPRVKDTVRFDTPSGVPLDVELPDVDEPAPPSSEPTLDTIIEAGEKLLKQYPGDFGLEIGLDSLKEHREDIKRQSPRASESNGGAEK
ncbi:MAG: hypothetical protein M0R06_07515 [Sphaerochaeta sp.]|jgi:hypothetical protein|nr:hypothetical protein [Sphaerochaeta sp.]